MICNHFFNGWKVFKAKTCHWTNCCWSWLIFCQHIVWHPLLEVIHQGKSSNSHEEGQILGYLCQLCVHGGTNFNVSKGIWWQTTLHGENMASHENIGVACLIIMRSTVWIIIKPCRCDLQSILLNMEDVDNQFTLCKGPFQSMVIGWNLPTWWCRCERGVKQSFAKNN